VVPVRLDHRKRDLAPRPVAELVEVQRQVVEDPVPGGEIVEAEVPVVRLSSALGLFGIAGV
jgi:hypothetical protein